MISNDLQDKIKQCDAFQHELWSYRPLSPETLMSLKEYYRIGTTYSSNAIEGNSLTESETKVVIENGLTIEGKPLRDIYEAVGHAKAYDYLYELNREEPITEEIICNIHKFFYQQIDADKAGVFRKVPVFISGSRYAVAPVSEISKRVRQLVQWFISNPGLNAPSLSKRLGRSLRTTQRYLKKLSDKKLIIFKGVAKNGGYFGV